MPELWTSRAGARLFVVDEGRGPPVVMLHGGLADHRATLPVVAPLAGRFRLILPDVRGSGRSHFGGPLDWRMLSCDLAAVLDSAGIERAVIGGTSGGSGVAARFALDYPDRLAAVVFNLPHYAGTDVGPTAYQLEQLGGVAALAQRALTEGMGVLESAYAGLPDGIRERAIEMVRGFDPASYATTAAFLASGVQPFGSASELSAIRVPALILPGDDPMHPAETSALYARAMPHAQIGGDLAAFLEQVSV